MPAQRRRRAGIKTTLVERLLSAGFVVGFNEQILLCQILNIIISAILTEN